MEEEGGLKTRDLNFRTLLARVGSAYHAALTRPLSEASGYHRFSVCVCISRLRCAACVPAESRAGTGAGFLASTVGGLEQSLETGQCHALITPSYSEVQVQPEQGGGRATLSLFPYDKGDSSHCQCRLLSTSCRGNGREQ